MSDAFLLTFNFYTLRKKRSWMYPTKQEALLALCDAAYAAYVSWTMHSDPPNADRFMSIFQDMELGEGSRQLQDSTRRKLVEYFAFHVGGVYSAILSSVGSPCQQTTGVWRFDPSAHTVPVLKPPKLWIDPPVSVMFLPAPHPCYSRCSCEVRSFP